MPSPAVQVAVVCVSIALVAPAPALSDDVAPPPPGTPSIAQYVETVPSSGGGWSQVRGPRSKPLRPAVARHPRQRPGQLTQQLRDVATSPAYGAPQHKFSRPAKPQKQATKSSDESSPLGAAFGAVSSSGDSHIYWLLAAMIVVTTTMVWAAARRNAR